MNKYLKTLDKKDVDELFKPMPRLRALLDLKSTLAHPALEKLPKLPGEEINAEIASLREQKAKKLEEIKVKNGWSEELMARINIMEDCRVFVKDDPMRK